MNNTITVPTKIKTWSLSLWYVCLFFVGGLQLASAESTSALAAMPFSVDDNYSTAFNTTLSRTGTAPDGLFANDYDVYQVSYFGGGSLGGFIGSYTAGTTANVNGHSVTVNSDGSFTYVPANGFSGILTFYYISNGGGALVTINVLAPVCPSGSTLYVNDDATGNNNGHSWADAFTNLQDALTSACPGITQIWVAEGTYYPGTQRDDAFVMKKNLAVLGGFPNTGDPQLPARNWKSHETVLSGEIGTALNTDNSYHVINNDNANGLDYSAVLDGFTIKGGNANGTLQLETYGGGMLNANGYPTVNNCLFTGNLANRGAAIFHSGDNNDLPTRINNCTFTNNQNSVPAGVVEAASGKINLYNCLIVDNNGYAFYASYNSYSDLINCTFVNNTQGALTGWLVSTQTVKNCVFWDNGATEIEIAGQPAAVSNTIIKNGYSGGCNDCPNGDGNIAPLFVDQFNGDLRLQACSPAIDAGDDSANPTTTDLDGNDRAFQAISGTPTIDLGAYEYQATLTITTYYVDTDGDDYGTGPGQDFCLNPGPGWALQAGDCDDSNFDVNPAAPEVCDGIDNNCIDGIDENDVCCPSGHILYVNDDATGNNNGHSWADAFTDLQDALTSACPGITQIWVAEGTYTPGTARADAFVMKNNLAIYGGFPNTGNPGFSDRNADPATNGTMLSGEIGAAGNADNSYHVIYNNNNGLKSTAVLDGFTITGGNADGSFPDNYGGGMSNVSSSPTVSNCTFSGNSASSGGGMSNDDDSSPMVINCTFSGNSANVWGGGMSNVYSSPTVTNCIFSGNSANRGGGMYNLVSYFSVTNCSFSGNSASGGGVMYNVYSRPSVTNCIIWGNSSQFLNDTSGTPVTYSIVQGGDTGIGNLYVDPLFVSQPPVGLGTSGDLRLQECSPAVDTGTSSGAPATDLDGNGRVDAAPGNGIVDIGAYEFQGAVPVLTPVCASNLTVQLDANLTTTVTAAEIGDSSDGCAPLSFLIDGENSLTFDCDGVGLQTVTLQVTDLFMNVETTTCSFTVADDVNTCCDEPVANCQAFSAVLVGSSVTVTPADVDAGSTADCGLATWSVSPNIFDCTDVGTPHTVTLTITDINGNSDACQTTVSVQDAEKPVPSCPADISVDNAAGQCGAAVHFDIDVSDNCPGASVSADWSSGSFFPVGLTMVTVSAVDAAGDTDQCTFSVSVQDTEKPMPICPADVSVVNAAGQCGAAVHFDIDVSDNCPGASVSADWSSGSFFPVGLTMVTVSAVDAAGNTDQCTFSVSVQDTEKPMPICPADVSVDNAAGQCGAVVHFDIDVSDNCPGASVSADPPSGSFFPVGLTTVTVSAVDAAGNSDQCTFSVSVQDTEKPDISCPAGFTVNNDPGQCGANVTIPSAITADNCPGDIILKGRTRPVDANGNAIGPWSARVNDPSGYFAVGRHQVQWRAQDQAGNRRQCKFVFEVLDAETPLAICPANVSVSNDEGECGAVVAFNIDVSDNCPGATVNADQASGSFFSVGTTTVTVSATDAAGHTDQCTFEVTINDTEDPKAICPGNITVDNDDGDCGAVVAYSIDVSDNCTGAMVSADVPSGSFFSVGSTTVTVSATDAAGNTDDCTFDITVNDTEAPIITTCAGSTVHFNGEESFHSEDVITFVATDNCDIVSTNYDPPLITCEDLGSTVTVTITVTDANGNPSTCTADVIVDGLPCGFMLSELGCAGDADYDVPTETFTLEATSCYYTAPFNQDRATFVESELCGDGEIIAEVSALTPFAWAGVMMRETLAAGSKKVALSHDSGHFARRESRAATNGPAYPQQFPAFGKKWLRLVRQGHQFVGYVSNNGSFWQQVMVANISMEDCIYVGLFLTNKQPNQSGAADFRHVEIHSLNSGPKLQQAPATSLAPVPDVSVYPNPTNGLIHLDLGAMLDKEVRLEVWNTKGQVMQQIDLGRVGVPQFTWQLSRLPAGIYWLRVQAAGQVPIAKRVMLQRP